MKHHPNDRVSSAKTVFAKIATSMHGDKLKVPFSRDQSLFAVIQGRDAASQAGSRCDNCAPRDPPNTTAGTASKSKRPSLMLPGFYYHTSRDMRKVDPNDEQSFREYLTQQLDVTRLLQVFQHLWLAGQPKAARPLHYQVMIGRAIVLTERADRHLTWSGHSMFLKPLPDFLLEYSIWEQHMLADDMLYESASGFLLSYMWLINSKTDLEIAQKNGLLSSEIDWDFWVDFSDSILSNIDHRGLTRINPRYLYGEIRLSRLNLIWRFLHRPWSFADLARGYAIVNREYSRFASKSFAWLLGSFLYITVVLTAMQVGLAANNLDTNPRFQNASYGFTVFSIVAPLFGVAVITVLLLCALVFNLNYTRRINRCQKDTYTRLWQNPALRQHQRPAAVHSNSKTSTNSTSKGTDTSHVVCSAV
jgi:hypothetical protein